MAESEVAWEFDGPDFWIGASTLLLALLIVTPLVLLRPEPPFWPALPLCFAVALIGWPWIVGSWLIVGMPLGWTIRTALRRNSSLSINLVAYVAAGAFTAFLAFLAYIQAGGVPFGDNGAAPPTGEVLGLLIQHLDLIGPVLIESGLLTGAAWFVASWRARADARSARSKRRRYV